VIIKFSSPITIILSYRYSSAVINFGGIGIAFDTTEGFSETERF